MSSDCWSVPLSHGVLSSAFLLLISLSVCTRVCSRDSRLFDHHRRVSVCACAGLVQLLVHTRRTGRSAAATAEQRNHTRCDWRRCVPSRLMFSLMPLCCCVRLLHVCVGFYIFVGGLALGSEWYAIALAVLVVFIGLSYCVSGLACHDDRQTAAAVKNGAATGGGGGAQTEGGWKDPDHGQSAL